SLSLAEPSVLRPSLSQSRPIRLNQPAGLVRRATRCCRHFWISCVYAELLPASPAWLRPTPAASTAATNPIPECNIVYSFTNTSAPSWRTEQFLATAQEQSVQFSDRHLHPRWPAVIALPGTLGRFHLTQKCVHFRQSQAPVGAHRAVTSHPLQHFVLHFLQPTRIAVRDQIAEHVAYELGDVGAFEQPGIALHGDALRAAA